MLAILLLTQLKSRRNRLDIDKGGNIEDLQKEKGQKKTEETKNVSKIAEADKPKDAYP